MTLAGKQFLIVGGTSGIGLQTAKHLSGKGAGVVIVGSNQEKINAAIAQLPSDSYSVCCDLSKPEEVIRIFECCKNRKNIFDGMVYSAGVSPLMSVAENDCKIMERTFNINCLSFIECVKYFQQIDVCAERGSIVVISSVAASQASNRQSVYAGSKAAVEAAVRCMAKELMLRHIRVNALALGAVRTELFETLEKKNPNLESRYPLGAVPMEQVSNAISYLLSEETSYMTGSIVKIDSGHDSWLR